MEEIILGRNQIVDGMKGFLIICVVIGHCSVGTISGLIYLFHMPLFFIISGYLINIKRFNIVYCFSKIKTLMIPYVCYMLFDFLIFRKDLSISTVRLFWGGRGLPGVYWYITCFLFAFTIFHIMLSFLPMQTCKVMVLIMGFLAIIESNLLTGKLGETMVDAIPQISRLKDLLYLPGIPWNLDVALLAVVYLAIGYYSKGKISKFFNSKNRKLCCIAFVFTLIIILFCFFNYRAKEPIYYFDMKYVYYHGFLCSVIVPCIFGFVLLVSLKILSGIKILSWLNSGLAFMGRMTIPIMFMHVPLNAWIESLGHGRTAYVLIGIGFPIVFTILFYRFKVMRILFGLPELTTL